MKAIGYHSASTATNNRMQKYANKSRQLALILLAALGLAACAAGPAPQGPVPDEAQQARSAEAVGNFAEAAELWQQAALVSAGPDREFFRVRAADAWLRAGRPDRSVRLLSTIDESRLSAGNFATYSLLQAEIALESSDLDRAEFYLDAAARTLRPDQRARHASLVQRSARLRTDPAGFALAAVASALDEMEQYDTSYGVALLQLLEDVPSRVLGRIREAPLSADRLEGWPTLAVTLRQALVAGADLEVLARDWAANFPGHVVSESGFVDLGQAYRELYRLPAQIAVLLPGEGGVAAAGRAIRDGMLSAFVQDQAPVSMRFHATTDNPDSAISAYFAALGEGAQWIIGPLRRESVDALGGLGSLGVPFLMLNTPTEDRQPLDDSLVFSLALSQEAEARAIARKALDSGMTSAITLSVDTAWGRRVEAAFTEAYLEGGGSLTASERFIPEERDHGALLTRLLQIDQSSERKDRLQATLGIALSFAPTRRDDFDMFFLAAEPEQGRQVRPQLRYYDAGSKPVLAMGRIFSGTVNRDLDLDLNGIMFPTTRWHVEQHATDALPASVRDGSFGSLYDLGQDAWRLTPWLSLMRKDPDLRFPGATGSLTMDEWGRLQREPIWAWFTGGAPQPLSLGRE